MQKPVLLCLHGWGGSKESFTELREALKGVDVEILAPDLPGFGGQPDPMLPWTIDDYAEWVEKWLKQEIPARQYPPKTLHVLGHSHGGRVAIKMAIRRNIRIKHLYLCAAAGIRHSRHFKRIVGLTLAKTGKALTKIPGMSVFAPMGKKFLYRLVRVHDYEKASPIMRQTMIAVTREDLTPLLHNVRIPTDIFWGRDDAMTPVSDAYVIRDRIARSRLHIFPRVRHAVHRKKATEIAKVIVRHLPG